MTVTCSSVEGERIAWITRLYLVVHGRPPDLAGLIAFVEHLGKGVSLRQLAEEFVASEEFTNRLGAGDAVATLCHNALGPGAAPLLLAAHGSAGELAEALVLSPDARERLAVLPALYPHGVPLDNPFDYRVWLSQQPPAPALGNAVDDPALIAPMLSFVMVLDRPTIPWLKAAIASVLTQPFPHAELILVARRRFPKFVRREASVTSRLCLVRAPPWCGLAALFNRALKRCRGRFVALIGQHDRLADGAAADLAAAAARADILLADDDALNAEGLRHSPRLGAAWDPDRTIATGSRGVVLFRTALARQIGGCRPWMGGWHNGGEWDLLLRAAVTVLESRIVHVPRILLSRRDTPQSLPPRAAHRRAVHRYLRAAGRPGCQVRIDNGLLRVVHPLPRTPPLVSIVIPTRDRADLLRTCTEALLRRTAYPYMELVIVDNGSSDADAVMLLADLAHDPRVRLIAAPGPFNWSALNNAGVARMAGDVAVLLNNDIDVIDAFWLRELVSQAMRPEIGIVGAKLLYPDRSIQHAGVTLGPAGRATHMWRHSPGGARGYQDLLVSPRQSTAMTGACLALRREVYLAAGGCEQTHLPITWNDVDLCLRVQALGLHALWTPYACLLHLEQATRGTDETEENQRRYKRELVWMKARWGPALDADPFLSPHLRRSEDPRETAPRLAT